MFTRRVAVSCDSSAIYDPKRCKSRDLFLWKNPWLKLLAWKSTRPDFLPPFGLCHTGTRDDKLIKTVVVHDGSLPVRYYMFLFPDVDEPKEDLGGPLFLTPLLQQGRVQEARWRAEFRNCLGFPIFQFSRKLSRVSKLSLPRPVESYSGMSSSLICKFHKILSSHVILQIHKYIPICPKGFFNVNSSANSNLFFWFFPAQNGNTSAPLVLWLQVHFLSSEIFWGFLCREVIIWS